MRHPNIARLLCLLVVSMLLAACGTSGTATIGAGGLNGPAISPLLTGLSQDQLGKYETWFRNPQGAASPFTPDANGNLPGTPVVLDPQCGLSYAYAQMSSQVSGNAWSAGWDGLALDPVRVGAGLDTGFFNPTTQQVLFILEGYDLQQSSKSCTDRTPGFIPARLDLASGRWNVEGFASPGATVQIKISTAFQMVALKSAHEIDDSVSSYVSPLRLDRFALTDANFTRVSTYATLSKTGPGRQIYWFRTSDLSPSYTHQLTDVSAAGLPISGSTLCLPAVAFWASQNGCGSIVPGLGGKDPVVAGGTENVGSSAATMFLDAHARQVPAGGSDNVAGQNGDDQSGDVMSDSDWQKTIDLLKQLAQNSSETDQRGSNPALVAKRKDLLTQIQGILNAGAGVGGGAATPPPCAQKVGGCSQLRGSGSQGGGNVPADNALPSVLGGWDNAGTDVFGVVADNGNEAYGETMDRLKDSSLPATEPLIGFVGEPNPGGTPLHETAVVISPSMWTASANASDTAQSAFYDAHSFIFNSGTNSFSVMGFSTDDPSKIASSADQATINGDTPGIPYIQSPATRFEFDVSNSLDTSNTATYTSAWIPTMALWQNGPLSGIEISYNPLFQFPQAVTQAINSLVYNIYSSTVGALATSLSKAATNNLLAVPELSQYQVLYYASDGQAIYALKDGPDGKPVPGCSALIGRPHFDPTVSTAAADQCLVSNGMFDLWNAVRSLSLLLFIALVARYFYGLLLRERAEIKVVGFVARAFLALGIIFGMNAIIGILSRVIAEAILVTDLIGTRLSDGVPYSHLWLFASYLSAPNHDLGVFLLMLLAPFMIIGFFFLLIVNWLRIVMTILLIMLSPIWVISLMADPAMKTFYTGLRVMMRLYMIPLTSLVILLVLFLLAKTINVTAGKGDSPEGAVVGMLMLIALAILPFILSKYITAPVTAIQAAITGALASADKAALNRQLMEGANLDSDPGLPEGIKNPMMAGAGALGGAASALGGKALDALDAHLPGRGDGQAQLGAGEGAGETDTEASDPTNELDAATELPQLTAGTAEPGEGVAAPLDSQIDFGLTDPDTQLGFGLEAEESVDGVPLLPFGLGEPGNPLTDAELDELAPPATRSGGRRLLSGATAAARMAGGKSLNIARDLAVAPIIGEMAGIGAQVKEGLMGDAANPHSGLIGTLAGGGVLGTLTGTSLIGGSNWSPAVAAADLALMHSQAVTKLGKFAGARRSAVLGGSSALVERWERKDLERASAQATWQQSEAQLRQVEAKQGTVVRELESLAGRGPSTLAAGPTKAAYVELRQIDRQLASGSLAPKAKTTLLESRDKIAKANPELITRYEGERTARANFVTVRRLDRQIAASADPKQIEALSGQRQTILDADPDWSNRYQEVTGRASAIKGEIETARQTAQSAFVAYDTASAAPAFLPVARVGKAVRQGWAAGADEPGRLGAAISAGAAELAGGPRLDHVSAARAARLDRVSESLSGQVRQLGAGPQDPAKTAMLNDLSTKLARVDAERDTIAAGAQERSMLAERARLRRGEQAATLTEELDGARETIRGHEQTVRSLDWLRERTARDVAKGRLTPDALTRVDARLASARNENAQVASRARGLEDDIHRLAIGATTARTSDAIDASAIVARAAVRSARSAQAATMINTRPTTRQVAAEQTQSQEAAQATRATSARPAASPALDDQPQERLSAGQTKNLDQAPLSPGIRVRNPETNRRGVVTEVITNTADGDWVYAVHFDGSPESETEDVLGSQLQNEQYHSPAPQISQPKTVRASVSAPVSSPPPAQARISSAPTAPPARPPSAPAAKTSAPAAPAQTESDYAKHRADLAKRAAAVKPIVVKSVITKQTTAPGAKRTAAKLVIDDEWYQFQGYDGSSHCRLQAYDLSTGSLAIVTNVSGAGTSVTNMAASLASQIWRDLGRPGQFSFVEHYEDRQQAYLRVEFKHGPDGFIDPPTWHPISPAELEAVLGQSLREAGLT